MFRISLAIAGVLMSMITTVDAVAVADMEDLTLPPESFYNGSDEAGGFISHGVTFGNTFDTTFGSWYGFAYSNTSDTTTPGFFNQYSSFTGADVSGSGIYGVGFDPTATLYGTVPVVTLPPGTKPVSIYLTNATYPALSMRDGDFFAKKFGGSSGDDPDWFKLTITGLRPSGAVTGSLDFFLADFRFADNGLDYIIDQWTWVDLTPLGAASRMQFTLSSSDNGSFGMNTPSYFVLDNLATVPVPPAAVIVSAILLGVTARRQRTTETA